MSTYLLSRMRLCVPVRQHNFISNKGKQNKYLGFAAKYHNRKIHKVVSEINQDGGVLYQKGGWLHP